MSQLSSQSLQRSVTPSPILYRSELNVREVSANSPELDERALGARQLKAEKMASLGELVTGIAHEINNSVNFIHGNMGYADRYMQDLLKLVSLYQQAMPEAPIEIHQHIEQMDLEFVIEDFPKIQASMQLGSNHIYEIVQSLRTFSRSDEHHDPSFDLHSGIDSTLVMLNHRLKGNGDRPTITIEKQYGQIPTLECYAGRINQVLMNLLSHAISSIETQITQPFSPTKLVDWVPCITIGTTYAETDWVILTIQDNGCGMPLHVNAPIPNSSFSTMSQVGAGLGLASCQKIIVQDHQGSLDCESSLTQGTLFTLRLPRIQDHPHPPSVNS